MKKIISVILVLTLIFALSGCGAPAKEEELTVRVSVLSGPTGIGALKLWDNADKGVSAQKYAFSLAASNDEIIAAVAGGETDIAAVATNLAASLYNKTNGGVSVLALNTGCVLTLLSRGVLTSPEELRGRDIFLTGQGANPEYIVRYALGKCGLDAEKDVTLRFVGDASELAGVYASPENENAIIIAPEPMATSVKTRFDCKTAQKASSLLGDENGVYMGCVIVRNEFLNAHPDAVETFLSEYRDSIEAAKEEPAEAAALAGQKGIIASASLAESAIPSCDLMFTSSGDMKEKLSAYLEMLYSFNPKAVGDTLPGDDFYYEAD